MKLCRLPRVTAGRRANKVTDRGVNWLPGAVVYCPQFKCKIDGNSTAGQHKPFAVFQCKSEKSHCRHVSAVRLHTSSVKKLIT